MPVRGQRLGAEFAVARRAPRSPTPRASNGTNASRIKRSRLRPALPTRASASAGVAQYGTGPCRRSRGGASSGSPAAPIVAIAASRSARLSTGANAGVGEADLAEQGFLGQPILRDRQRARVREHLRALGQPLRGLGRHVLEIEGGDVDARARNRPARRSRASPRAAAARPGRRRHRPRCRRPGSARPSGAPASASMRASWPPPRMPTVSWATRAAVSAYAVAPAIRRARHARPRGSGWRARFGLSGGTLQRVASVASAAPASPRRAAPH